MNTVKRVLCAVLLLLLTGCAGAPEQAPYQVAMVVKSTESEFFKSVFAGANAAAAEYNIHLTISGPETEEDVLTQNRLIDEAVAEGADALVLSAVSYDGNTAAVDRAAEKGLKIVVIDSDVNSRAVQVRIGTDNFDAGRKAAQTLMERPGDLTIGIVNYDTGSYNGQERERGFRMTAAREERVRRLYTINVLADREDARRQTVELLQQHPEINAIAAFNEPTCVGAAMAVEELGLAGEVRMVGFDSNVEAVDMLYDGVISALVVQNPYAMGYLGLEAAHQLLSSSAPDPKDRINTSSIVVDQRSMFTAEGQKALFSFQ